MRDALRKKNTVVLPRSRGHDEARRCVAYSFGSRDDTAFEAALLSDAPSCELHIFDKTGVSLPEAKDLLESPEPPPVSGPQRGASMALQLDLFAINVLRKSVHPTRP